MRLPPQPQQRKMQFREILAWITVLGQFMLLLSCSKYFGETSTKTNTAFSSPSSQSYKTRAAFVNNSSNEDGPVSVNSETSVASDKQTRSFTDDKTGERVVQIFHAPPPGLQALDHLKGGSCWCTPAPDNFCSCTPSMAIDVVLTSGEDHVWLVKRGDGSGYALMGGFVEIGETPEQSVQRELGEETGLVLSHPPLLLGVYADPMRDALRHRHSVSIVYVVHVDEAETPQGGDDVQHVERVALDDIMREDGGKDEKESFKLFVDHKTVLQDYMRKREAFFVNVDSRKEKGQDFVEPVQRSVCPVLH